MGDDAGLAGAGAGDDQERALIVSDGAPLLRVEIGEDRGLCGWIRGLLAHPLGRLGSERLGSERLCSRRFRTRRGGRQDERLLLGGGSPVRHRLIKAARAIGVRVRRSHAAGS